MSKKHGSQNKSALSPPVTGFARLTVAGLIYLAHPSHVMWRNYVAYSIFYACAGVGAGACINSAIGIISDVQGILTITTRTWEKVLEEHSG